MKKTSNVFFLLIFSISFCSQTNENQKNVNNSKNLNYNTTKIINEMGKTIEKRFNPCVGFYRKPAADNSFANYLRNLPLKPMDSKVKYFNGDTKLKNVYDAVVDMEISNKDLQQCADAILRLRGEYFYSQKDFNKISFNLTNGFEVDYSEWIKGKRVKVNGNKTYWEKVTNPSNTYKDFRKYMEFIFTYAGTISLSKSLHSKKIEDIEIGDVFVYGGSPGHAVIVVDLAEDKNGHKAFILAQSYMPAQETQILKNFENPQISPWYLLDDIKDYLYTPEYTFKTSQLKTW